MKKLLPILLIFFSMNSYSGWFKVVESENTTSFIDDQKITKKDKFIRVWTLTNQKNPIKLDNGKIYRSYVSLVEIDCHEDKSRELSVTLYSNNMGTGNPIITLDETSKWSFSPPGSIRDSLIQFSCGFK